MQGPLSRQVAVKGGKPTGNWKLESGSQEPEYICGLWGRSQCSIRD